MAYNSSNLNLPNFGSFEAILQGYQYIWKYTTTDNLSDVFGIDPITGNPYIVSEPRIRNHDLIAVQAADGSAWGLAGAGQGGSGNVTLTRCDPHS